MSSKSLGVLTLNLVAKVSGFEEGMDKASRKSQKTAKQIERYSNQIAAALTAGTAAAVTGMAALVTSTAESAREVQNLSRLAGSSPQAFQKLTYAAKRYGIEQDKVSDILKDTNDRIGDFIQTGGGPMADFFENIAPKVGVTADEFARLSGPDALQLYVKSLEDAGVSQKDMTFYMEAIASDATALVPLLRDNGKEMKSLGDEAERTGNVFSDMEFDQLESVRRGMDELTGAATGMKNEVVMAAIPAIDDLIKMLSDDQTIESAKALGTAVVTSMNFVIEAIDGAVRVTQFLAEELAAFVHGPAVDDIPRLTEKMEDLGEAMADQEQRLKNMRKTPGLIPKEVLKVEEERLRRIRAEYESVSELIENARKNQSAKEGAGTGVVPVEMTAVGSGEGSGNTAGGSGGIVTGEESDIESRVESIRQAFETEKQEVLRIYGERNEEIAALYEADAISKMEADHLKIQSEQEMQDQLKQIRQNAADEEARLQQQRQVLLLAGTENLFGSMADLAGTFAGEQSALYKTMFAVQKAAAIAQSIVAIQSSIAMAANGPFPYNIGAMATVAAATAGIVGNIKAVGLNISGQAHDGIMSIPEDGTWNLQKGERVTTAKTSAKLDATLDQVIKSSTSGSAAAPIVNIIENPDKAGTVEARQDSQGRQIIDVMIADAFNGGPVSKAYGTVFGLKRQGR